MTMEWKLIGELADEMQDGRQLMFWQPDYGAELAAWSDELGGFWDTGFTGEIDGDPIAVGTSGVSHFAIVEEPVD